MTAPIKAVSDVTVYVDDYAAFVANPIPAEEDRWNSLWAKLTESQRWKLATRAQVIVDDEEDTL